MEKYKKYARTSLALAIMSIITPSVSANHLLQNEQGYEEIVPELRAFSELAQQVRYFYPSNAVANSDWDSFLRDSFKVLRDTPSEQRVDKGIELIQAIAPYVQRNVIHLPSVENDESVNVWIQSGASTNHIYFRDLTTGTFQELTQFPYFTQQTYFASTYQGRDIYIPLYLPIDSALLGTAYQAGNPYNLVTNMTGTETCMAAVSSMWAEIQHFWPYFGHVDVNWSQTHLPLFNACIGARNEFEYKVNEQFSLLGDNHVWINYPEEIVPFKHYKLPFTLSYIDEKALVVNRTDFLSLQVELGDELISIDGQTIDYWLDYYKGRTLKAGLTEKEQSLNLLTRYTDSRLVNMVFRKSSGEEYGVTSATVHYKVTGPYKGQGVVPHYSELVRYHENGVAQLMAYNVTVNNLPDVKRLLEKASAIVIDFRHYPTSFQGWKQLFAWLLSTEAKSGTLDFRYQMMPDQTEKFDYTFRQTITPEGAGVNIPLVALSSRSSISQNEHALMFLQDANIPILGVPTAGINGDIVYSHKFGGYQQGGISYIYTGMSARQTNGEALIGVGVLPDMYAPRTAKSIENQEDNQLIQGISYLKKQL
ncbi:hypothetical protein [Pseudoalteromonas sp. MMG005]|uniref:hypothetical protein n=1 Tax=Pseudoalteromonas sp. MMG005 TaxID=2822682 RepID=UPI001B3A640A|nr:hypothetical protein [Pseudoalteromonas sp. MMG005]MBQ4847014.1 hypothetical protein [Pseudoalteromonas sp. MMG005]